MCLGKQGGEEVHHVTTLIEGKFLDRTTQGQQHNQSAGCVYKQKTVESLTFFLQICTKIQLYAVDDSLWKQSHAEREKCSFRLVLI